MSKKLTVSNNPARLLNCNSGERNVGHDFFIEKIIHEEPFISFFNIKDDVLNAITDDMKKNGFDQSKPVVLWKKPDGSLVLIDGHTRVKAAMKAGLLKVTAYEKTFIDEFTAMEYVLHTQKNRRNIDDSERLRAIEYFDSRKKPGPKSASAEAEYIPERSAEQTAKSCNTSRSTVDRTRLVLKDPEETKLVKEGKKSIYQASKDIKAKKQAQKTFLDVPTPPVCTNSSSCASCKEAIEKALQEHRLKELSDSGDAKYLSTRIEILEWFIKDVLPQE